MSAASNDVRKIGLVLCVSFFISCFNSTVYYILQKYWFMMDQNFKVLMLAFHQGTFAKL